MEGDRMISNQAHYQTISAKREKVSHFRGKKFCERDGQSEAV